MRTIYHVFFLLCLAFYANSQDLRSPICPLPLGADTPEWAKLMYQPEEKINVFQIDSLYEAYYRDKAFMKNNYVRFYKRWRVKAAPFVKPDGTVDVDKMKAAAGEVVQPQKKSSANARTNAGNWTAVGPLNTFQGEGNVDLGKELPWQVNVYTFDIAPSNSSVLYAGGETGGIFKTVDKGLNWTYVSKDLPGSSIMSIAIHPTDPNTVLAGKGTTIIKTTDGGATWTTTLNNGEESRELKFHPNGSVAYATTNGGVYKSTNGGSTWVKIFSANAMDLEFNSANPNTVYVVAKSATNDLQFYTSTNAGASFTQVTNGLAGIQANDGARMAVTAADANILYIVTLDYSPATGIGLPKLLKSTNGGTSWLVVATGETAQWGMNNWQGYYDLDIAVSPTNANVVFTGTASLFKSTDGGVNHVAVGGYGGPFPVHPDIQCIKIMGNDTWLATDGGFTHSTDLFTNTANAHSRNNGIFGSDFWGFDQAWNEDIMMGGRYHNGNTVLYQNYPAGHSLRMGGAEDVTGIAVLPHDRAVNFGDLNFCKSCLVPAAIGDVVTAGPSFSVYLNQEGYGKYMGEIVYHPQYYNTFFFTLGNRLWKSTNGGASSSVLYDFGVLAWRIEIPRSNPDIIYVTTQNGIYKSTNAGTSFTQLSLPAAYAYYNTDIAVNPADANELIALISNRVYKTTNGGSSWTNLTTATLAGKTFNALTWHPGTNGGLYLTGVAPGASVFYRDNSMSDWLDYSSGLPYGFYANFTRPFYKKNKLRLAGNLGIWETPLSAHPAPVAEPWTKQKITTTCNGAIQFNSYSVADDNGLTYQWSFPTGVPATSSIRNPQVVFNGLGAHTASLTVTNAYGSSTKSIGISIIDGVCHPDTLAGKSIVLPTTAVGPIQLSKVNVTGNTFTIMAWIKPNGAQNSFSQIVSTLAPNTRFGLGFSFQGYNPNMNLIFSHDAVSYGITSSVNLVADKWNHITLTYNATTGVKIYLNGQTPWVYNGVLGPVDFSKNTFFINQDVHGQGSSVKAEMDELRFYNAELTQAQIREKMHLIPKDVTTEAGLVSYYQFNQYETDTETLYPAYGGGTSSGVSSAYITTSTAPVATGTSFRIPNVSTAGPHLFTGTNLSLTFGSNNPNGELVVSRLNGFPDVLPAMGNYHNQYWIVRNYGSNQTFNPLNQIVFSGITTGSNTSSTLNLYKRTSNEDLNNWENLGTASASTPVSVTFGSAANITSFSQFLIGGNSPLPLRLISFTTTVISNQQVQLKWEVTEDNETASYEVQRSDNGLTWNDVIYTLDSEGGDRKSYNFTDKQPRKGWNYYRLKLTGKDNKPFYSRINAALIKESDVEFNVYPVPADKTQPLHLEANLQTSVGYTFYDKTGKEIIKGEFVGHKEVDISKLNSGIYILLMKGKEYMEFKKVVIP